MVSFIRFSFDRTRGGRFEAQVEKLGIIRSHAAGGKS
jgi:hypothetical protein